MVINSLINESPNNNYVTFSSSNNNHVCIADTFFYEGSEGNVGKCMFIIRTRRYVQVIQYEHTQVPLIIIFTTSALKSD